MENVREEIEKINNHVKKYMWMDFSYEYITDSEIKIVGSIDLSYEELYSIEIFFTLASSIATTLFDWSKDDTKPFIELVEKDEILKKLDYVNEDSYFFKINVEGYSEAPIWIVAKSIRCNILKDE